VSAWTYGGSTFAPLAIGACDLRHYRCLVRSRRAHGIVPRVLCNFDPTRAACRGDLGTAFAHAGVGVALIGIVCETTWNSEYIGSMKPDDVAKVAGYG
jgi:cytochrome c-type biogenesis protein CcmF